MKDSGIDWIREIPVDWKVCRFKNVASLYTGNSISDLLKEHFEDSKDAYPYIATKDIDASFSTVNYCNGLYVKYDNFSFSIAPKNSSLMCIEGGSAGRKKAFINQDVAFVNKLCCFNGKETDPKYLYYFISSPNYEEEFNNNITGLIGGVSVAVLKNFSYLLPTKEEQQIISNYLDSKCSKIDEYIAKQQQLIEKLKEYKQAIITEAVTKGLNPDVPMKDSGIEWIGKIPEHWIICKFGRCAKVKSNLVAPEQYMEYPQLSPECIEKNSARLLSYNSVRESGVVSWNHLFYKGQIIYSKVRPLLNKVIIAPFDGLCSADMYPIETDSDNQFFVYLILSDYFHNQVAIVTENRVKMPKINQDELSNIYVAIPPLDEQQRISEFLFKKCKSIDDLLEKKQTLIDRMTEYKKSLIYEVVTGKKEI